MWRLVDCCFEQAINYKNYIGELTCNDVSKFECADKEKCIYPTALCDGYSHCKDDSDETDLCACKYLTFLKFCLKIFILGPSST